jgi:nicotinamide mononucleotide (NMN) deamidase PncC
MQKPIRLLYNRTKKYEGKKYAIVATGGGMGVLDLARIPGVSKLLHTIYVPYSAEETNAFVQENLGDDKLQEFQAVSNVSQEAVELLCAAAKNKWKDCNILVCSAALTSNRYRRGNNHAWVAHCCDETVVVKHFTLDKIPQEEHERNEDLPLYKRYAEDLQITEKLLSLIFNTPIDIRNS